MPSPLITERKRAKRPKVKTGCITCKIRRVKCDETKPECIRCQKFGEDYCDGYQGDRQRQPRAGFLPHVRGRQLAQKLTPKADPAISVFENQDEYRCFYLYHEEIAHQLSTSCTSIWPRLLLQAGQDQPFIRHAIIAIGGLSRAVKMMGNRRIKMHTKAAPVSLSTTSEHERKCIQAHQFGLHHYDRFLTGARGRIAGAKEGGEMRTAIIVCILVVCIEYMQYNHEAAATHALKGFNLMDTMLKEIPDFVGLTSGMYPLALSGKLEDELIEQFGRLEMQVMAMRDTRSAGVHRRLQHEASNRMHKMPHTFRNAHDAKVWFELIMRRTHHFMACSLPDIPRPIIFSESGTPAASFWDNLANRKVPRLASTVQVEQESYQAENRRWTKAFEPIYRSTLNDMEQPDSIGVLLLKIHSLSLTIGLAANFAISELVYDHFVPQFEMIVILAKKILHHPQSDELFAEGCYRFDVSLINPLLLPAISCRNRQIRREAIALLLSKPWREAHTGSLSSADIAQFIMNVEEDGVETDHIPEWARARLIGININVEDQIADLHCIRGVGELAVHIQSTRNWTEKC